MSAHAFATLAVCIPLVVASRAWSRSPRITFAGPRWVRWLALRAARSRDE